MINPLVSVLRTGGVATLTVAGRATGQAAHHTGHTGRRERAALPGVPYGESDWIRNLRAAGKGELHGRGERETIQATEVPPEERAAIITAYRRIAGRTVDAGFTDLPDPGQHPVFRIG